MARYQDAGYILGAEDALWFGGAAAGRPGTIKGTPGDDVLHGTAGNDVFRVDQGGDDTLRGGAGDDRFLFGTTYTDADVVVGGSGYDKVVLQGTLDPNIVLSAANFRGIERLSLTYTDHSPSTNFVVTLQYGVGSLQIDATQGDRPFNIDGSSLTTGHLQVSTWIGDDVIIGGDGNDIIRGFIGADQLTGGNGNDVFLYKSTSESVVGLRNSFVDLITDFASGDRIFLPNGRGNGVDTYHIGQTAERVGDVVVSYNEPMDRTRLDIFVNADDDPDMTIDLSGNLTNFTVNHGNQIILI